MSKTTVIYHSADFDGLFCREIARKLLPPDTVFIGWDFGGKPICLDGVEGTVYVMDLPMDRPFGFQFGSEDDQFTRRQAILLGTLDVIWIDHHKSSLETCPDDIAGYRIDGVAACRLAWQWFQEDQVSHRTGESPQLPDRRQFIDRVVSEPLAVRLAGEYDIWDKRDPNAEIFQFGLRSRELTDTDWAEMLRPIQEGDEVINSMLHDGLLLQSYQQRNDASTMSRSYLLEFEGLKFLALNTARCNSLTFDVKDVPETGHDALMGYYFDGEKWNVSLYHAKHNTGIDLSQIATKHKGGGHSGACGFRSDKLPFITQ